MIAIPRSGSAELKVDGRIVTVGRLELPMWPVAGITRADVLDYYAAAAPALLPYLADREPTLARFPEGVTQRGVRERHGAELRDRAGLLEVVARGAVEIHVPLGAVPAMPRAVVWELEPGPGRDLGEACAVAMELHGLLAADGLQAWPASTGAFGLRVTAPLAPGHDHDATSDYALRLAMSLVAAAPSRITIDEAVPARTNRVLVSWEVNAPGRALVAPYSLRAMLPAPGTCAPLTWDEVKAAATNGGPESVRFTPQALLRRIERFGDLGASTLNGLQTLPG